ncbi:MAG: hypothetical protein LIO76_07570 [Clostridiales bacterium]|nr:hypothetical protein [Clostridiales bacterium]
MEEISTLFFLIFTWFSLQNTGRERKMHVTVWAGSGRREAAADAAGDAKRETI